MIFLMFHKYNIVFSYSLCHNAKDFLSEDEIVFSMILGKTIKKIMLYRNNSIDEYMDIVCVFVVSVFLF